MTHNSQYRYFNASVMLKITDNNSEIKEVYRREIYKKPSHVDTAFKIKVSVFWFDVIDVLSYL